MAHTTSGKRTISQNQWHTDDNSARPAASTLSRTAAPSRPSMAAAVLVALAIGLGLLGPTAHAQPNTCYPTANKRAPFKKGACFMVSHTLQMFFGVDVTPAMDPRSNNFVVVDRHTGAPIDPACQRTKVYLSTDASDTNLGNFKREAWAAQALSLVQGKLVVNFATIGANLPASRSRKPSKQPNATETVFIMEFECPTVPSGTGKRATKAPRRSEFRIAVRVVPPPTVSSPFNLYQQLLVHLQTLYGPVASPGGASVTSLAAAGAEAASMDLSPSLDLIHRPSIGTANSVLSQKDGYTAFCGLMGKAQTDILTNATIVNSLVACGGDYPSYLQGIIDESKSLGTDKLGLRLPGPMANLRLQNNGRLPDQVPWAMIEDEKATLYWLFDKTQRLGPWAACADGSVPYAFENGFAPGFVPYNYYRIHNAFEYPGSNFVDTTLCMSGVGPDRANQNTFVLISRGTRARTEWMADLDYKQILVDDGVVAQDPLLTPFHNMAVHSRFLGLFKQIYAAIKADVTTVNPARIMVAGHSLGGGLCQLLSLALATDFPSIPVDAALFAVDAQVNRREAFFASTE